MPLWSPFKSGQSGPALYKIAVTEKNQNFRTCNAANAETKAHINLMKCVILSVGKISTGKETRLKACNKTLSVLAFICPLQGKPR